MSSVVFDPARAKVDSAYRTEAMELYKKGELKISDNDLKWLKQVLGTSTDDNSYEIEDLDADNKEDVSKTNVVRKKGTDEAHGKFDLAVSSTAMGLSTMIGLKAASGLSGWHAQMTGCNSMATEIACITAFAIGTKYELTRPNKDEHKELETLKTSMETGDIELANALIKLQESEGEVEVLREEVHVLQETADEEIDPKQEELEKKQARIEELNAKAQSEEGLTDEERAELETLTGEVQVLQDEIGEVKDDATGEAEDKQGEIENKQADIDEAESVFNSVLDIANYAETFDEASKDSATLEAVAQGVNAAMGFGAAAALTFHSPILSLTPYGQIMRGLALAGAGMSTHGVIEQAGFAKDIGEEIKVREDIQGKGDEAIAELDVGTQNVEDGIVDADAVIDNLENAEKTEKAPAENQPAPTVNQPGADSAAESDDNNDDDKKDKPEE